MSQFDPKRPVGSIEAVDQQTGLSSKLDLVEKFCDLSIDDLRMGNRGHVAKAGKLYNPCAAQNREQNPCYCMC